MQHETRHAPAAEQTAMFADLAIRLIRARLAAPGSPITVPDGFDIHGFIRFAGSHGAAAALADGARKAGLAGPFAAGLQMMLDALQQSNANRNMTMRSQLVDVGQLLRESAVRCVALKGGAFLAESRSGCSWRTLSDLDLLVPFDLMDRAVEALSGTGYVAALHNDDYRAEDRHHFTPLMRPGAPAAVELHSRFVWDGSIDPLDPNRVISNSMSSFIDGIFVANHIDRVVHVITHGQIGDKGHAGRCVTLKDLVDFSDLVARGGIDWTRVDQAFDRVGKRDVLCGFLATAETVFDGILPASQLDLQAGRKWSRQALDNLKSGRSEQASAALDIAKDYAGRVLFRKGGLALLARTLTDRQKLSNLWRSQYGKWRR